MECLKWQRFPVAGLAEEWLVECPLLCDWDVRFTERKAPWPLLSLLPEVGSFYKHPGGGREKIEMQ